MRQFLAVAILGTTLAVTASAAFADDRSGGVQDYDRSPRVTNPTNQNASPISGTAGKFAAPIRQSRNTDHERP